MPTKIPPTAAERDNAYEIATKTDSGEMPLDMAKYRKANEVLKESDIEKEYFKLPPRFEQMISEAMTIMRKTYRDYLHYNHRKMIRITSEKLQLNRKLSHYAEGEEWALEMNVAAIFHMCRSHPFLNTKKFFQNNLKGPTFSPESVNMISLYVMAAPDISAIYRDKHEDVSVWQMRVMEFLEELAKAPVPCTIIFLAQELSVLYMIKHDLKKQNPKAWKHLRHLSKKEQLWYYGKIVQIIGTLSHDKHISEILAEYREVSMKIFKLLGNKNSELVPVKVEG